MLQEDEIQHHHDVGEEDDVRCFHCFYYFIYPPGRQTWGNVCWEMKGWMSRVRVFLMSSILAWGVGESCISACRSKGLGLVVDFGLRVMG